jgi:translation initiation factor 2 alpha subunit (eIF-2alpha)
VKGIDDSSASFHRERNSKIYYEYTTTKQTMEQLAEKHGLTKQRVWQIVRRCEMGSGDYYKGFEAFRDKQDSLKELGISEEQMHKLLRKWMHEKFDIKTIALKDERE